MNQGDMQNTNSHIVERVVKLESQVDSIEKSIRLPWYKDRRFWSGAAAMPLLLVCGWAADTVVSDGVISFIHAGFGTHRAIQDNLSMNRDYRLGVARLFAHDISPGSENFFDALVNMIDHDEYQDKLVVELAHVIGTGESEIQSALESSLENHFLSHDGFNQLLYNAISERTRFLHLDSLSIGLTDVEMVELGIWDDSVPGCRYGRINELDREAPDQVDALPPNSSGCPLRYPESSIIPSTTTNFLADSDQLVDILLFVRVWKINERLLAIGGQHQPGFLQDVRSTEILDVLSVELNGNPIEQLIDQQSSAALNADSGAEDYYYYFISTGNRIQVTEGDPLPTIPLTFELIDDPQTTIASITVLVRRSGT